jgi:hypothetical protein
VNHLPWNLKIKLNDHKIHSASARITDSNIFRAQNIIRRQIMYWPNNMEHCAFWEYDRCTSVQEIFCLYGTSRFQTIWSKEPTAGPILSTWILSRHHLFNVNFNIILASTFCLPSYFFTWDFLITIVYAFIVTYSVVHNIGYVPALSHPLCDYPNNI